MISDPTLAADLLAVVEVVNQRLALVESVLRNQIRQAPAPHQTGRPRLTVIQGGR